MKPNEFVETVVDLFEKRTSVFANKVNVEDWVPQDLDPKGKASFLFFLTQLDYAIKSSLLYQGALNLYDVNAKFFMAETIYELSDKELADLLSKYLRPRYINEAVYRYKVNSCKMLDKYEGDPRNIFRHGSAPEVLKKVWEFRGFGPKTGNLFFRSMVTTFNFNLLDIETVFQPVDIHDVRIAKLMDFVDSDEMSSKNIQTVKKLWNSACLEANVNWLVFDKALWLLGSVGKPSSKDDILSLIKT